MIKIALKLNDITSQRLFLKLLGFCQIFTIMVLARLFILKVIVTLIKLFITYYITVSFRERIVGIGGQLNNNYLFQLEIGISTVSLVCLQDN